MSLCCLSLANCPLPVSLCLLSLWLCSRCDALPSLSLWLCSPPVTVCLSLCFNHFTPNLFCPPFFFVVPHCIAFNLFLSVFPFLTPPIRVFLAQYWRWVSLLDFTPNQSPQASRCVTGPAQHSSTFKSLSFTNVLGLHVLWLFSLDKIILLCTIVYILSPNHHPKPNHYTNLSAS